MQKEDLEGLAFWVRLMSSKQGIVAPPPTFTSLPSTVYGGSIPLEDKVQKARSWISQAPEL